MADVSKEAFVVLIESLHCQEVSLNDIMFILRQEGYVLSRRHLGRLLAKYGLRRRQYCQLADLANFIDQTLQGSGVLHGYRWMYERCLASGVKCRKEDVRLILGPLDAEGVELRKRHRLRRRQYSAAGPNFIWHVDGYDKLKPFGLCVSGCIDEFSRKIIWLDVYKTNSDPQVIGGYYMTVVQKLNGCPLIIRTDPGTENACIRDLQKFLLRNCDPEGNYVYLCGSSTANQRIEAFWGQLRKECIEYWLAGLHKLQYSGDYSGDFLDNNIMQMCFTGILQVCFACLI
jgi:hypothetical protein